MMLVLGIISAVCFLLLVIKYPLRKLGFHKANAFMMKLHEAASLGVIVFGFIQLVVGIKKYRRTSPLAVISGIIAYVIDFIIVTACHMTKEPVKKMRDHRRLSLAASIASLVHIILSVIKK